MFPQANLLAWCGKKTKTNTTKACIIVIRRNVLQHKINTKKLKPGLVALYNILPGNRAYLLSILEGKDIQWRRKVRKSEEKRKRGEAYDTSENIAPNSKIESKAHYVPEPVQNTTKNLVSYSHFKRRG